MKRILCIILGCAAWAVASAKLSTPFADVKVNRVPIGLSYRVIGSSGKSLTLENGGDEPIRVAIEFLIPDKNQLRDDAIKIPSLSWVKASPAILDIPPHSTMESQITIRVPKIEKYHHRHYQVMVWSHSVHMEGQGMSVSTGLLSRVQFTTK